MLRRTFLQTIMGAAAPPSAWNSIRIGRAVAERPAGLRSCAEEVSVVFRSPDPATRYAGSPGLALLSSGRLVVTCDIFGPETKLGMPYDPSTWPSLVYTSDDRGRTWILRARTATFHARPFTAGNKLYILGHSNDLLIHCSEDEGLTWSPPAALTEGEYWHQAPCNVLYRDDRVYLVMERKLDPQFRGWPVSVMAPVVMTARIDDDLMKRDSWTFSEEVSFREMLERFGEPNLLGIPFYKTGPTAPNNASDHRDMSPAGWLETHLFQITDPDHLWYDPGQRTLHLLMRAHTGATNHACLAKAVIDEDNSKISIDLERAPSGKPVLYIPCPGGHLKFHILYDEQSALYWLVSNQSTDSLTRPDRLSVNRYNLPNNERHRLALYFSKNCYDWIFAGMAADTGNPAQARAYPSMVIDGDDLHVLARSGDAAAKNAHDTNLITFHTVRQFRSLVY